MTKLKNFSKNQQKSLIVIFLFLLLISIPNFNLSLKRARDAQRRDALGKITGFLKEFRDKNSYYPYATDDGRIIGCNPQGDVEIVYSVCSWDYKYADEFTYFSDGNRYQIFAYLEVTEPGSEYQEEVFLRNIKCGDMTCNTGRASFRTPLDKTLEQYQNELDAHEKKK